jgi:starvation-inducible DNA-binding protein
VKGPQFYQLHPIFEKLYDAAAEAGDQIAERIVALGGRPPTTLKDALAITHIREDEGATGAAENMVRAIIGDLVHLNGELRDIASEIEDSDRITANILDDLAAEQEKETWMLRSFAGEGGQLSTAAEPPRARARGNTPPKTAGA